MHQTSTGIKKNIIQQLLKSRSGPIVPGNFSFFFFFGACAGLVHLVVCFFGFFGACAGLVTLTSQNIDRHQKKQKKQTTRCTKHRQLLLAIEFLHHLIYIFFGSGTQMRNSTRRPAPKFQAVGSTVQLQLTYILLSPHSILILDG